MAANLRQPRHRSHGERGQAAEARRQRRAGRSAGPIVYKLPSHVEANNPGLTVKSEPTTSPEDSDVDYAPFVRGCLRGAAVILLVQVLASVILANLVGGIVRIAFWFRFIPYLEIGVAPSEYGRIITWSTTAAVSAGCLGLLVALVRHRKEPMLIDGWACVLPMSIFLLALQQFREWLTGWDLVDAWVFGQVLAATVGAGLLYFGFRPGAKEANQQEPRQTALI